MLAKLTKREKAVLKNALVEYISDLEIMLYVSDYDFKHLKSEKLFAKKLLKEIKDNEKK